MDHKIIKKNGDVVWLNSQNGARAVVSAEQVTKLCNEDKLTIKVNSAEPINVGIGDTMDVYGTTYTINEPPQLVINGPRSLEYTFTLEGPQYALRDKVYILPSGTQGDYLMTDLRGHATALINNINRGASGKPYALGNVPETIAKNVSVSGQNCLAVLQTLCNTFEAEFTMVEGAQSIVINFGAVGSTFPLVVKYGLTGAAYRLTRTKGPSELVTRLFVYGGSQNLTYYRNARLCLPNKTREQSYIENAEQIAKYGLKEGVKNFDSIYPNRVGTVTSVGEYNEFIDSSMNFDLNEKWANTDEACTEWIALRGIENTQQNRTIYFNSVAGKTTRYLMPGTTAKIHFNTGDLAGYECDIHSYNAATKKFTLVPLVDENGYDFPSRLNSAFKIHAGDKYVILDINLPDQYKNDAEAELQSAAQTYYSTVSEPVYKYSLELSPAVLKRLSGGIEGQTFKVGDYIHVIDDTNNTDANIRIDSFTRDLINPWVYRITLSDDVVISISTKQLIEEKQIKQIVEQSPIVDVNYVRKSYKSAQEVYDNVFDTEGQIYGEKIQPLSIDTQMLKIGARSQQFTLKDVTLTATATTLSNTAGALAHYTIDDDGVKTWTIAANTLNNLSASALYLYAKCAVNGTTGEIVASAQQIVFDSVPLYYYFLIGTLGSKDSNNARAVSLTYGFSTINGRFVKTGRIASTDGNTFFDLDSGQIHGNISFSAGGVPTEVTQAQQTANNALNGVNGLEIGGRNLLPMSFYNAENNGCTITKNENGSITIVGTPTYTTVQLTQTLNSAMVGQYTLSTDKAVPSNARLLIAITNTTTGGWKRAEMVAAGAKSITVTFGDNEALRYIGIYAPNLEPISITYFIKLERGNKATDWTPAPEDTDAKIEDVEQGLKIYQDALADTTEIAGGLVLTNTILLKNGSGTVSGGVSGSSGVAFWAGGTFAQALTNAASVIINRDGSAKFGLLRFIKSGVITMLNRGKQVLKIMNANVTSDFSSGVLSKIFNFASKQTVLQDTSGTATYSFSETFVIENRFDGAVIQSPSVITTAISTPNKAGIEVVLQLKKDGSEYVNHTVTINASGASASTLTDDWDLQNTSLEAGTYTLVATYRVIAGTWSGSSFTVSSVSGIAVYCDLNEPHTELGNNGILVGMNGANYFSASIVNNVLKLAARGTQDFSGLLYAGTATNQGSLNKKYIVKSLTISNATHTSTGVYTFAIGGLSSAPIANAVPVGSSNVNYHCIINTQTTSAIQVRCLNGTTLTDMPFNLFIYGSL